MGKKQQILIIEDNEALAEIYKTRLELLGYAVTVAHDGVDGLYYAKNNRTDLILLDIMMPDLDGGEVLRVIRKSTWGPKTPVFIISNLNETEAPTDLRHFGISGYAVKSNMMDDTVDKIVNGILRPDEKTDSQVKPTKQTDVRYQDIPVAADPADPPAVSPY